jgi:hypothetical protein
MKTLVSEHFRFEGDTLLGPQPVMELMEQRGHVIHHISLGLVPNISRASAFITDWSCWYWQS